MWNISSSLGKSFFTAGFLPALIFIAAIDFVIIPRLAGGPHWVDVEFLGIPGAAYILGSLFGGILLLALNTPIIKLYENGVLVSKWLTERNLRAHQQRYTALLARRAAYHATQAQGEGLEEAIAKLETVYKLIEAKFGYTQTLPINEKNVKPTALGNTFALIEEYPYQRYGMDTMSYWPRLLALIPADYTGQIADLKTTLDFWLNLSLLTSLFGIGVLGINIWPLNILFIFFSFLALIVGYIFYRMAVRATADLGEIVMSCFDLFRGSLLEKLGLPKPNSLLAEQHLWLLLTSFIRRGEDFYFPLTLEFDNNRALLQQELSRHTHNLYLLQQQTAIYAVGEAPLYLLNQCEAEARIIEDIKAKVSA